MTQEHPLTGILAEEIRYSLDEFSRCCGVQVEETLLLVHEGVVQPQGEEPASWAFDVSALQRARRAWRLRRQLELDLHAVALLLDLLEERERLRERLRLLEYQIQQR